MTEPLQVSPRNREFKSLTNYILFDYPYILVVFVAGLCCDGYALRRVMDCGRLTFTLK